MLDGNVVLPAVRHLVGGFVSDRRISQTAAEAPIQLVLSIRSTGTRVRNGIDEPPVGRGEIPDERRIHATDLERIQAVAVEELPGAHADRPLAASRGIPGEAEARREHVIIIVPQRAVWSRDSTRPCWTRVSLLGGI